MILSLAAVLCFGNTGAQEAAPEKDTLKSGQENRDKINLLVYARVISDSKGNGRVDENIVPAFRLTDWLTLEAGIRYGQRPQQLNSYYHYKIELQTKSFWKTARVIARISDNVIIYPTPSYRKTNCLFAIETKYALSRSWLAMAAGGYVFSAQQNNATDATPSSKGVPSSYPVFKLALRYRFKAGGFTEAAFGSYDVFNPYALNSPFVQAAAEFRISRSCTSYSAFRYQYANSVNTPLNYFLVLGLKFHLCRDKKS
ncbi:MAG: hypothetical protein ACXVP0_08395 [Bacteroidia bacterium]